MYPTKYHKPASLDAAAAVLSSGEDAMILAGGQTLLATMKQRLAAPGDLVDIRAIEGLSDISAAGEVVTIGATATHAEVAQNAEVREKCPALAKLAAGIGDPAVRHMGTIGGSIANNDPAADYPAALLALGATIVSNTREIAADDFFEGLFTTALAEGEIITAIRFTAPSRAGWAKFAQPASRFALVGVFAVQGAHGADGADGVRVAVTGAGEDGVFRAAAFEDALAANWSADALAGAAVSADGLLSDIHGAADYRAHLIGVMAGRAVSGAS